MQEQTEKLKWYSMMYHCRRALDSDSWTGGLGLGPPLVAVVFGRM